MEQGLASGLLVRRSNSVAGFKNTVKIVGNKLGNIQNPQRIHIKTN